MSSKPSGSRQIFLLSPARSDGERARMLANPTAQFVLAQRLRRRQATLGEVFAFLSGLYFRGKLAYATKFARPPAGAEGVWVITSNRGLMSAQALISPATFASFATVPIDENEPRYLLPLRRSLLRLRATLDEDAPVVLLGSIATDKYVGVTREVFGERLLFPAEFAERGDMSRGGLMLRHAAAGEELDYIPVEGAMRRAKRPPKLPPVTPGKRAVSRG